VGLLLILVELCRRKITVVASDGNDVEPVEVDRLLVAVSETYDVIVTIPADKTAYEF
jgi:FtsP/CotA-like multicopper oxidase with cupredoxin domain